jgi:hypothetical protein
VLTIDNIWEIEMTGQATKAKILGVVKAAESPAHKEVKTPANKIRKAAADQKKGKKTVASLKQEEPLKWSEVMSLTPGEQPEQRKNPKILPSVPARKILHPVPERTEEERQAVRANYKLWEKQLPKSTLPKRILPMEGKVADNIARDQLTVIRRKLFKLIRETLSERLLADPALAIPTWEILMDNNLTVRRKARKLQVIGWEVIPMDKSFWWICLLAEILGEGID